MSQKFKRFFQLLAVTLAISLVIFQLNGTTFAARIDYDGLAAQSGGCFTAAGIQHFAKRLRDDYVPVMLGNITRNFKSLSKPAIPNLKIGLEPAYQPTNKKFAGTIVSNGRRYTLRINLEHLKNTPQGEVVTDGVFYSYITHEFMHAVMFDVVSRYAGQNSLPRRRIN